MLGMVSPFQNTSKFFISAIKSQFWIFSIYACRGTVQWRNQNGFLNVHIKKLQDELATRPTLAIVKQEIGKYASEGRISSLTTLSGLQGSPRLEKAEAKFFRAFRTQLRHNAQVCNWTPEMEALHLPLALSQNIYDEMLRCVPNYRNMTADQIFHAWHRRICPSSVRDIAVAALSRAETLYMDA